MYVRKNQNHQFLNARKNVAIGVIDQVERGEQNQRDSRSGDGVI
jgi:hypothetical protein